jgi:hypothetical protein
VASPAEMNGCFHRRRRLCFVYKLGLTQRSLYIKLVKDLPAEDRKFTPYFVERLASCTLVAQSPEKKSLFQISEAP